MGDAGLRARLTRQGEDALGKLAQELFENPMVSGALTRAFDAREKAVQAQEVAMNALNLPSAADLERLTRRLRSVSQRLEGIEDGLDRLEERIERLGESSAIENRLVAIEADIERVGKRVEDNTKATKAATKSAGTKTASLDKAGEKRLKGIETQMATVAGEVRELRGALPAKTQPAAARQTRPAADRAKKS